MFPFFQWSFLQSKEGASFKHVFLTVFLERKRDIAGVPLGRTELSVCGNSTDFCACAILRWEGLMGLGFQGMPEK